MIRRPVGSRRFRSSGARGGRFAPRRAWAAGQRVLLDYYIVTNPPLGGATLAARVLPSDLATLRSELERIARSVTITRPIVADPKP